VIFEILIFANFRFEILEVPVKVITRDRVQEENRFVLNWKEYSRHLKESGLDPDPACRPFFSRYEAPRPDMQFIDQLLGLQAEVREVLDRISGEQVIPLEFWQTIFREADKLTETVVPKPAVRSDVSEDLLKYLIFEKSVTSETYRAYLYGELRDMILGKKIFLIRKCPECGVYFLDQTKNRSKVYCNSETCGNRAKQRAFSERRRAREARFQQPIDFMHQYTE